MKTSSDPVTVWSRLIRLVAVASVLAAVLLPVAATALSLSELRASGVVGERYDGYAVVRETPAPAGVRAFVDQVNAQRQSIYEERAAQQGVTPGQVGRVYARQIYQEVPAGTWFLDESGSWVRK